MCAIVDASVLGEVFGKGQNEASSKFLEWVYAKKSRLVVGGYQREELCKSKKVEEWISGGLQAGNIQIRDYEELEVEAKNLIERRILKSNDSHVIALAILSHARLLYSNDKALHDDFKNHQLINNPRGKVYSTNRSTKFATAHKKLLENKDLCRDGCTQGRA